VCLGTNCNIGSKRPCCPLASDAKTVPEMTYNVFSGTLNPTHFTCPLASDVEPSHVISTVHLWHRAVPLQTFAVDIVIINCCRL